MIKGYPIRQAKASYGTIKVDGNRSSDEKWTTENADQLKMGNVTKNKTTVDFAYDNDNLYLTARVIDRNIINTGLDNDGIRFFIDADNVSDTEPVQGMYSLFLDTDGSMKLQRGDNGRWVTDSNTDGIQYALNLKSFYYDVEVAIPWNKLGKSSAPVNQRMAIALEIANKEEFRLTNEVIPDVDNNASWTWLEFVLEENSDVANIEYDAKINVKLKDKPDNTRTATDDNDDIVDDLTEAGIAVGVALDEYKENFLSENKYISAVYNLMRSWIHGNKAFSILLLLPVFTLASRWSFRKSLVGHRFNLTEQFFAQVYIACQILWISLLILPFTREAHLNDIFDLSYEAIFLLFVWDYRQLFNLSWWKSFKRTTVMFCYCALIMLLAATLFITLLATIAYLR